jgi:hypothetical protein
MVRERLAAVTAALLLWTPGVRAAEPSSGASSTTPSAEPAPVETGTSFSDRFFRGTSPGELPTEKLAFVAGLYVAAGTSVGIGIATLVGASSKGDDADTFKHAQAPGFCNDLASPGCATYRRLLAEERSRRETGILLLGIGGLFALGGGVTAELWQNDAGPSVALIVEDHGLSLGLSGRF